MKETAEVARKVFDTYDKNKDGVLTANELKPLLKRVAKLLNLPPANDKDIDEGIKRLDLNANKALEFDEFFQFFKDVYQDLKDKAS